MFDQTFINPLVVRSFNIVVLGAIPPVCRDIRIDAVVARLGYLASIVL